jgi:hypothetical protein
VRDHPEGRTAPTGPCLRTPWASLQAWACSRRANVQSTLAANLGTQFLACSKLGQIVQSLSFHFPPIPLCLFPPLHPSRCPLPNTIAGFTQTLSGASLSDGVILRARKWSSEKVQLRKELLRERIPANKKVSLHTGSQGTSDTTRVWILGRELETTAACTKRREEKGIQEKRQIRLEARGGRRLLPRACQTVRAQSPCQQVP